MIPTCVASFIRPVESMHAPIRMKPVPLNGSGRLWLLPRRALTEQSQGQTWSGDACFHLQKHASNPDRSKPDASPQCGHHTGHAFGYWRCGRSPRMNPSKSSRKPARCFRLHVCNARRDAFRPVQNHDRSRPAHGVFARVEDAGMCAGDAGIIRPCMRPGMKKGIAVM